MRTSLRLASVLAVVGLCSSAPLEDGVLLRLEFHEGDVLRYRMTQAQTMESEAFGAMETTSTFVFRQKVASVDEAGVASVVVTYDALRMSVEGPVSMSYDSTRTGDAAKGNDPTLASTMGPLLESELTLEFEPSGHVRSIRGAAEMLEKLSAGGANPMLEALFSDESLSRMFEASIYPTEAVEVGAEWKRSLEMKLPMLGVMKIEMGSRFAGMETHEGLSCAKIELAGDVSIEPDPDQQLPFTVSITDPEVVGVQYFAIELGRMVELSVETELTMNLGAGEGDPSMNMEMSMTMTQHYAQIALDAPAFD